jgi:DNA-binding transcriptional LysR family regulator
VTLRQLLTFATVARLGSVKAAARELGISEPAVSGAVGVLRRELNDELYRATGHGLVLTPSGERLGGLAGEINNLADRARWSLDEESPVTRLLRVAVTMTVEEHVAAPLLAAFTDRTPNVDATVEVESGARFAELLDHRRADITLGPRPSLARSADIVAVPFLRYRLIVVAAPDHPLAARDEIDPSELTGERWLIGPGAADAVTPIGEYFARSRLAPRDVRAFPSDAAALGAVAEGEGVMLALGHVAAPSIQRRAIRRLAVRGTPLTDLWYASTLAENLCLTSALALRRFATTPEATQAMAAPRRGVPAAAIRPSVHTTLWSSVSRSAPG